MLQITKKYSSQLIIFAMILIQSGVYGAIINCAGVLISGVISDMGYRTGDMSLFYTIRTFVAAFMMPISIKLFYKYNSKLVMGILSTICVVTLASMSLFNHLWQWYVAAALRGLGTSGIILIIPIVLNNWFSKKNGVIIGVVSASSGITGAIFNPMFSNTIINYGWRTATLLFAAIAFFLLFVPSLTIFKFAPNKDAAELKAAQNLQSKQNSFEVVNIKGLFTICILVNIFIGLISHFTNYLPIYAISFNYSINVGALLTSLAMIGNVTGKIFLGILSDKFGILTAIKIIVTIVILSLILYLLFGYNIIAIYIASFIFGNVYSVIITAPALLLLKLYGPAQYQNKLAKMQSINLFVVAIISIAIPYSYDLTGSFNLFFVVGISLCIISALLVWYIELNFKKQST